MTLYLTYSHGRGWLFPSWGLGRRRTIRGAIRDAILWHRSAHRNDLLRCLPAASLRRAFPKADLDISRSASGWHVVAYFFGDSEITALSASGRTCREACERLVKRRKAARRGKR